MSEPRILPPAKETGPHEELKVSKQQSAFYSDEVRSDEESAEDMEDTCSWPSYGNPGFKLHEDSPMWTNPATPSFTPKTTYFNEWELNFVFGSSEPCEETVAFQPCSSESLKIEDLVVTSTKDWQFYAKDFIQNKMRKDSNLDIFLKTEGHFAGLKATPILSDILSKLQNNKYETKSSFECALNEIAEITQRNSEKETEVWWKSEYLKLFFRIHWDAVLNYKYTDDELSVMNWKLNKIRRKLQPPEKPLWNFSPGHL